jgi:hypothetical protein
MSTLFEQALEQVNPLPHEENDEAWTMSFAAKRDMIRRMAQEALDEDDRGETVPLEDLI